MRYLILSDIHANLEALEATLEHAEDQYDAMVCCGDLVGYGADPNDVTDWVRANIKHVVRGNHDKVAVGLEDLEWFNPHARASAEWTRKVLTPENRDYLMRLPKGPFEVNSFQIVHGSPLDEDEYLLDVPEIEQAADYLEIAVSFFGHTHMQGGFHCHRNGVRRLPGPKAKEERRVIELEPGELYLLNPGSIGQPRDGDPRAAYAVYDSEARTVTFVRTAYSVSAAQDKIIEAGLPPLLAKRLATGN